MKDRHIVTSRQSQEAKSAPSQGYRASKTVASDALKVTKQRFILGLSLSSFLGFAIATYQLFRVGVGYLEISLLLLMITLTAIGITVGFHRYFAHKTFQTTSAVEVVLAILGSMAGQGSLIAWVSVHRCHHQYTDQPGDPHSPNLHGSGFKGQLRGLWHAHIGWLLDNQLPNSLVFAKDLLKDPILSQINRFYVFWILMGLFMPFILGGIMTGSWAGALQGLIWGGLARLFLTFNSGYIINSIAHVYGQRPFNTTEQSKNNIWLVIPTFGEGWHNNHHAFPNSAKFGLKWWQVDLGYAVLSLLKLLNLAWDIKIPKSDAIAAKVRNISN